MTGRVLCVDDDEQVRNLIRHMLDSAVGVDGALGIVAGQRGTAFDPDVVDAFLG